MGQGTAGHFEMVHRWGYQGRVGDCQHRVLMATAHNGSSPNEDPTGHCDQAIMGMLASGQPHTRMELTSWKPQREGQVRALTLKESEQAKCGQGKRKVCVCAQ